MLGRKNQGKKILKIKIKIKKIRKVERGGKSWRGAEGLQGCSAIFRAFVSATDFYRPVTFSLSY